MAPAPTSPTRGAAALDSAVQTVRNKSPANTTAAGAHQSALWDVSTSPPTTTPGPVTASAPISRPAGGVHQSVAARRIADRAAPGAVSRTPDTAPSVPATTKTACCATDALSVITATARSASARATASRKDRCRTTSRAPSTISAVSADIGRGAYGQAPAAGRRTPGPPPPSGRSAGWVSSAGSGLAPVHHVAHPGANHVAVTPCRHCIGIESPKIPVA